jgi:ATP-dependent Clp protease protease subunit
MRAGFEDRPAGVCQLHRLDEEDEKSKTPPPEPQSSPVVKALFKSRTVLIFGEVDMKMAERVTAQLLAHAAEGEGDIRVIINSPGGHVESGDTIHDVMRFVGPQGEDDRHRLGGERRRAYLSRRAQGEPLRAAQHALPAASAARRHAQGQASDISIEAEEILKMQRAHQPHHRARDRPAL